MRVLAVVLVIMTGCFAPRPYHRAAYVVDGILAATAIAGLVWAEDHLDDPDARHGPYAEAVENTAPVVLIGAVVGTVITLIWSSPAAPPPPKPANTKPPLATPPTH